MIDTKASVTPVVKNMMERKQIITKKDWSDNVSHYEQNLSKETTTVYF